MPGVNDFNGMWLESALANALATLRQMQTQQQMTLTNLQGQPVLNFGLIPGSNPPAYGMQFLNPANGGQIMFLGEDGAGNTYQGFYNSSGVKVSQWDVNGLHFYDTSGNELIRVDSQGLHSYNTSAQEEARLGQLSSSPAIYGLGVAPSTGSAPGTLQQVGGFVGPVTPPDVTNATTPINPTYQAFGSPNSVTALVGPSGKVAVTTECEMSTGGTNYEAFVGIQIDSGSWSEMLALSVGVSGGVLCQTSNTRVLSTTAGTHTFTIGYSTANGSVNFYSPRLTVQPL